MSINYPENLLPIKLSPPGNLPIDKSSRRGYKSLKMLTKATVRDLKRQQKKLAKELATAQEIITNTQARADGVRSQLEHLEHVLSMAGGPLSKVNKSPDVQRTSALRLAMTKQFVEAKKPLSTVAVKRALRAQGLSFTEGHFWKVLWRMKGKNQIQRVGRGTYTYANGKTEA